MEMLETLQTAYEAKEDFDIITLLIQGKLYLSMIFVQMMMGSLTPMGILGMIQIFDFPEKARKALYSLSGVLALIGIFAMRWNVVVGGQFFSKSLRGFTTYKLELVGREGLLSAAVISCLPFLALAVLLYLFPPWNDAKNETGGEKQ